SCEQRRQPVGVGGASRNSPRCPSRSLLKPLQREVVGPLQTRLVDDRTARVTLQPDRKLVDTLMTHAQQQPQTRVLRSRTEPTLKRSLRSRCRQLVSGFDDREVVDGHLPALLSNL